MLKSIALFFIAAAAAVPAAAPTFATSVHIWKASELVAKGNALASKVDANKVATEALGTAGNREFLLAHREGSGQAEWHRLQADVVSIVSGSVTMIYGGTIVNPRNTTPNEIRGSAITGGTEVELGPGDALTVPPQTPHLMKVAPGKNVTYFVVKVTAK